jgi:cyclophilin family peptidyl-prolyl cis-trans isomerase/HEAT repeat protein
VTQGKRQKAKGKRICTFAFCLFPFAFLACGRHKLGPDELDRNRLFAEILKREDRRTAGDDEFFPTELERSPHPEVREWCAVALGRIGDPRALPWLYRGLRSEYASVRAAAAFGIGEIEDRATLEAEGREVAPGAAREVAAALDDPAPAVRMRAIEALGKLGRPAEAAVLLRHLEQISYRGAPEERTYFGLAITALQRLNQPAAVPYLERLAQEPDPELQWRAANALYRMRARAACATFARLLRNPDPDVRAHAARGLGICEDPEPAKALLPLVGAGSPLSVRVQAVAALGSLKSRRAVAAIRGALKASPISPANPDPVNFAVVAAGALASIGGPEAEQAVVPLLGCEGPVANAALVALARLCGGDARFFRLTRDVRLASPEAMRAWAQALGELGGAESIARLEDLLSAGGAEATAAVPAIVSALARARAPRLDALLDHFLQSRDGVTVRAAIAAYRPDDGVGAPWRRLIRAYAAFAPRNDVETKAAIAGALARWAAEPEVSAALGVMCHDRERGARSAAARALRSARVAGVPDDPGPAESTTTELTYNLLASQRKERTRALVETTRGAIEIELFREDAPLTVANFVSLARRGFYDGLSFMRVVPYFVIQGGDPRNDMEGGPGYTIRCEINLRPFERGSVGMALAGKDTGGSQFFITLSPQPHLDGGYTCFGRVTSGMSAADRMTAGDRIVRVTISEDKTWIDFRRY